MFNLFCRFGGPKLSDAAYAKYTEVNDPVCYLLFELLLMLVVVVAVIT